MKLLTTLAAATLAAPLLATPAQADPVNDFVIVRALTICWVTTGRDTLAQTMGYEARSLAETGMTAQQYRVFNKQSGEGEFIGELVDDYIKERGGCVKWLNDADTKPAKNTPSRGGYTL